MGGKSEEELWESEEDEERTLELGLIREHLKLKEGKHVNNPATPLSEDVYGFVMASLLRDSNDVKLHGMIKRLRILSSLTLYAVMFFLQVFLIANTKMLISPESVRNAKETYGAFEKHMYTDAGGVVHTVKTAAGYDRGIDGFFNPNNFATFDAEIKESACHIPLSQPHFLFVILWIWTLTVLSNVRKALNLIVRLFHIPSTTEDADQLDEDEEGNVVVERVSCWLKAVIVFVIQVPRILLCCFLLYLGSRWLIATLGFADLLLNAVALEFILCLADMLYTAMVPHHSQLMVQRTQLPHISEGGASPENCTNLFGTFVIAIIGVLYVYFYMYHFQQVLPDYNWDVHDVCKDYLAEMLKV